jgi:DNA helicase II / ATP-dependent DNA helicase PcrA
MYQLSDLELLRELNPPQREAVEHYEGPILILAGAGSGKTRVLTRRIALLVKKHNVAPSEILAVTFTNKAAGEMRERVYDLIGSLSRQAWIATFHSISLRILRRHAALLGYFASFVVYDSDDSKNVMLKILKERKIDHKKNPPQTFLKTIERFKTDYITPEQALRDSSSSREEETAELYMAYQRELLTVNAMDFTDLLFNVVKLFDKEDEILELYRRCFRFVLVDEFQDTNQIQYRFLKQLAAHHQNVLVVGDDDQSIYAFRGANPKSMIDFPNDFKNAKVVKLEENYRSTQVILDAAHAVIERNAVRIDKKLWTRQRGGDLISTCLAPREVEEARFVANEIKKQASRGISFGEMAIFYRTNAQSRALEEALVTTGIPYRVYGGLRFFDRKEIKDILAYLKVLINPRDALALVRVINTPPRGIGAKGAQLVLDRMTLCGGHALQAVNDVAKENQAVQKFALIMNKLSDLVGVIGLGSLVEKVFQQTGYIERLKKLKDYTALSRIENLRELQGIATEMEKLFSTPLEQIGALLDRSALMASDEKPSSEDDAEAKKMVSLMTLHLAKGLEFDCVFFTGLEEGLLPHYLNADTDQGLEEERRLMYVGFTRARKKLYLTRSESRVLFAFKQGVRPEERYRKASPFLFDIPECLLENGEQFAQKISYEKMTDDAPLSVGFGSAGFGVGMSRYAAANNVTKHSVNVLHSLRSAESLLELAPLSALSKGVLVQHEFFGQGVVESVDMNEHRPEDSRVSVFFTKLKSLKRLNYGFARLSLAS